MRYTVTVRSVDVLKFLIANPGMTKSKSRFKVVSFSSEKKEKNDLWSTGPEHLSKPSFSTDTK